MVPQEGVERTPRGCFRRGYVSLVFQGLLVTATYYRKCESTVLKPESNSKTLNSKNPRWNNIAATSPRLEAFAEAAAAEGTPGDSDEHRRVRRAGMLLLNSLLVDGTFCLFVCLFVCLFGRLIDILHLLLSPFPSHLCWQRPPRDFGDYPMC